ncbi:hypothetical protein WJ99_13890 [Burkholderia ubonensis]|uniref:hypothetical protein n=1 Tax=Burkholderia ubonensis TaxID=101571 RepID=UPI000754DE87|nr:hypothetical protein [Burkholderia ubonensis]KVQ12031.1 hypothetical protein WJ99_13890 [Burkholderia ubonensis]
MTTESKKSPAPEQASEAVPQRPRTENPTAEAIFEQAAGAGNLTNSKFGFGDGNNRADALTDDPCDSIEYAIQVLRQVETGDGTFVGQCADAITGLETILAASPVEQPAAAPADAQPRVQRDTDKRIGLLFESKEAADRWQARAAASPAAEAVAIPVEWDQDAAIEALSDFPKGSIWYEFLEEVGFDPTSGPIYVLTVQGRAMLDQLKSAYFAAPQPTEQTTTDEANGVTLDRRDLFDFARSAIKSALVDYKAGEEMTETWYWQEATTRAEALLEAIDTKSPYIEAAPAQTDAPADAGEPIGQHDLRTSAGGRGYIAEFFAKRLRRHDFDRYIAEQLAADFACALAQYLSEHDAASRAEPCVELPRFPKMLRKMWSGGEVQRWIDENVAPRAPLTNAVRDVLAERRRHVEQEGWTPEHDDQHTDGAMAHAAACYAYPELTAIAGLRPWPWDTTWWKPSAPRRNLVKAVALGIAEIERLDRAAAHAGERQ